MRWPVLGCCCALLATPAAAGEGIPLKTRTLGPAALRQSLAQPLTRLREGSSHYLLRFSAPPADEVLAALSARGVRTAARLSAETLLVSAPDEIDLNLPGLADPGRLSASDKLSPALAEETLSAWLVEFHPDVAAADSREIVTRAGLTMLSHPDLLPHQLLVTGDSARLESLAAWDEVAYIFPASLDLLMGAPVTGCAGALIEGSLAGQYVKMGGGWGVSDIRYFVQSLTGKIAAATAEAEILRAFQEWSRYARIDFSAASSATEKRTINVLFGSKSHGDNYPFDGSGKVLAHTFYPSPPNVEPIAGDMHFDADEAWHTGAAIDLFTVALHEAGHALGLAHSDRPTAVMYPYYRLATGLASDDIAGIRALYGSRDEPLQPSTPSTPSAVFGLTVTAPASTTTAESTTLSGTVQNATGTAQVAWSNSRGGAGQASGSSSWTIASVPLTMGANLITVKASDQGGHTASSAVTVTRQETGTSQPGSGSPAPPSLRITSPAFTIVSTSLANMSLRGTASASTVRVGWSTSTGQAGDASGTTAWTATVSLFVGTNTITVRAYDASGNSSWRALTAVRR